MYILAVVSYSSRIYLSFPVMANAVLSDTPQAHSKMLGLVHSGRQLQPALCPQLAGHSDWTSAAAQCQRVESVLA